MHRLLLLVGLVTPTAVALPRYGCTTPCHIPRDSVTYIDAPVGLLQLRTVARVRVRYPVPYSATTVRCASHAIDPLNPLLATYDPFVQAAQFEAFDSDGAGAATVNCSASAPVRLLVIGGEPSRGPLELVALPFLAFQVHGKYWSRQMVGWVFACVAYGLLLVYLGIKRHLQGWQVLALIAAATYVATLCDKTYHAIAAAYLVSDALQTALAVTCVATDALCALFATCMSARGRCWSLHWSVAALVVAAGSVWIGAGYWLGPGALGLAAVVIALVHAPKCV